MKKKEKSEEKEISENTPNVPNEEATQNVTCICEKHGDIGLAVLQLTVFNDFNHVYCMKCFDETLQKMGVNLVKLVEKK